VKIKDKEGFLFICMSSGLLTCCICIYCLLGLWSKFGFPTNQVLWAIPVALPMSLLVALVEPQKYGTFFSFLGSMIFGTTVFTGLYILFSLADHQSL
jgi:hypothetical protein